MVPRNTSINIIVSSPGDSALLIQGPVSLTVGSSYYITAEIATQSLMALKVWGGEEEGERGWDAVGRHGHGE